MKPREQNAAALAHLKFVSSDHRSGYLSVERALTNALSWLILKVPTFFLCLKSKAARAAIIQKFAAAFNLTPIIAEAFYQQFSLYFQEHANVSL